VVCKEDNVLSQTSAAVQPKTAPGFALMGVPDAVSSEKLLERILSSLDDDKAEDVISIPLRGKSEMADYMVICSGRSSRQVVAISENLTERLKHAFGLASKVEGKDQGDWVLIDAGDVIVHVFRPEVREFYQLEKMWATNPSAGRAASA
jgi:ribosome-associated protein